MMLSIATSIREKNRRLPAGFLVARPKYQVTLETSVPSFYNYIHQPVILMHTILHVCARTLVTDDFVVVLVIVWPHCAASASSAEMSRKAR
jgi:hypothetical protein